MKKVFLSYRREDSADIAGRIFDHLERRFGRAHLFLDVDSIRYGDDFRHRIEEALDQTGVLLVIIGDGWLEAANRANPQYARRLDDPDDYVSVEISAALTKGITIVPVLVGDAQMPQVAELPAHLAELAFRNAAEVRSGRDFPLHVNRLIDALADSLALPEHPRPSPGRDVPTPRLTISFSALEDNPKILVGAQLGAFVIERLLAAGGSGVAYLGRNPRTGQRVCVKVSLPVLTDMERIRTAVARGIRGLVALNHPHIVRVHEFEGLELADARSFYVVMDYVEGSSLDRWAASLPYNRERLLAILRIAHLITRALEAAHTCRYVDDAGFETVGVMHGDVKPGNILVRDDGTPVLMDFMLVDIHRVLDPTVRERFIHQGEALTQAFGTPGFMAPEQERDGVVTVRTDVYGLGATLRAVTGELSFPAFGALIDRMTGPVAHRPSDMGEVARSLCSVAQQEGLESAEMRRELRPETKGARRSLLSQIASIFRGDQRS